MFIRISLFKYIFKRVIGLFTFTKFLKHKKLKPKFDMVAIYFKLFHCVRIDVMNI